MTDLASWVGAGLIAATMWGGGHIIGSVTEVERVQMSLISLEYADGIVTQHHEVQGSEIIRAEWSAQITRQSTPLCGGGGTAPYEGGSLKSMTADEWTDDECPLLQSGDLLSATWEWLGSDNVRYRTSGTLVIQE